MLKIGEKAPDFVLPSDEGEEVSLENFKGRRILIFFIPKRIPRVEPSKRPSFVTQKQSSTSREW